MRRLAILIALLALLPGLAACASLGPASAAAETLADTDHEAADDPARRERAVDPFEPINRFNFGVHRIGDRFVLRPVALVYQTITPAPMRRGVGNFFSNLAMPVVIVNDLLQGKFQAAVDDTGRFIVNSTLGLLGFIDVASHAGMERPNEDFGQTLGSYGVTPGPYLFIPFIGPTTFRDGVGTVVDAVMHPLFWYGNSSRRDKMGILYAVDTRAGLLSLDGNIDNAADPYLFIREAYLQRREFLIHDGEPPDDDFYDLFDLDDLDALDDLDDLDGL